MANSSKKPVTGFSHTHIEFQNERFLNWISLECCSINGERKIRPISENRADFIGNPLKVLKCDICGAVWEQRSTEDGEHWGYLPVTFAPQHKYAANHSQDRVFRRNVPTKSFGKYYLYCLHLRVLAIEEMKYSCIAICIGCGTKLSLGENGEVKELLSHPSQFTKQIYRRLLHIQGA
tara:strand:+ start:4141 stop:4671 length:531 start_codon:yes stop_codon:yes gene_type:complete